MVSPTRVLCLGGGYVALYLARALRREIRSGRIALTIVSRDNFHTYHGFVAEMLVGRIQPGQIITPARRIFRPARFHNAEVEAIDLARRVVVTGRVLDGRQYTLPYDHLVLALGSQDDLSRYPGLAEHACRLRSYGDAFKVRNQLINALEMAEIEEDPAERRRLLTFVVVGGNYGGVEVAAELNDYFRAVVRREYALIDPREVRVVLIHSGERLLPELAQHQPRLQRWGERFLAGSGIEIRLRTRIAAATPEEAILDNGERISTHTIISCTGNEPPPVLAALPLVKDARGRIVTDRFGRAEGRAEIWAGGDCAAFPHPAGGINPPLAVYAMMTGRQIGINLRRTVAGEELAPYRFTGLGDAVALGRRAAVAHIRGIPFYGLPAWLLWRVALLGFVPTWDRRLRLMFDWALTPFLGREVVNMSPTEPAGIGPEIYEPGQDIVRQGDVGRRLYLIRSGEAEVIQGDQGHEERIATLGPGDHFGERAVFQNVRRTATVRARTRVEVLSLSQSAAVALSDALRPFHAAVHATPGNAAGTEDEPPGVANS
jgi:NADH dehydrogenase